VLVVLLSGVARADVVTDWNDQALDAIRAGATPPPKATRVLAMVHLAIFEAVNGIEGRYEPYGGVASNPDKHASPEVAAACAAYAVLVDLYPDRAGVLQQALFADLLRYGRSWRHALGGMAWGADCAAWALDARATDGSSDAVLFMPSGLFGAWQPTPPAFAPALLPQWPFVSPFAMLSEDQFRPPPPPPFDSLEYAEAYNEVKDLGRKTGSSRDADQTEIAFFWEDGAGTVTPPGHWQVIAQSFADRFRSNLSETARLFALLSITQADAAISCWEAKYHYDHVRPYTAITLEADADGNPLTAADPAWQSLIPTPPFASYTSGHSTFSSSSARLLALFFGSDDIAFSGSSPDPQRWPDALPGVVRSWSSLSEAAEEAGQSRIYGGIHWQYDNMAALASGRALADYVFENFLRPVDRHGPGKGPKKPKPSKSGVAAKAKSGKSGK
jgi:hypothetical protein